MTTIDKYLSLKGLSYDSFQKNDIDKSKLLFDMISQGFIDSYVKKIFGLITSRLIKEKKENKNLHDFYWQKQEEFKYIIDNEMNKISDFYDEIKKNNTIWYKNYWKKWKNNNWINKQNKRIKWK